MILAALLLSCPWLNQATAAGILGGPVVQTGCDFRGRLELHIEMVKEFRPHCGSDAVPLRAIGSEAVACPKEVMFRVRDQVFLVRMNTDDREKLRKVAESVAGSVF
jgi:hypothetical protein